MKGKTKAMKGKKAIFILTLKLPDLLTLLTLFLSGYALVNILNKRFFMAICFLFSGMIVDTFDGLIARKLKMESELGRYLDSFVDVILYPVSASFFLYAYGLSDIFSLMCFYIFIAAGILRLSRFNMVGIVHENEKMAYNGLPVFWIHFLLVALVMFRHFAPFPVFRIATNILLLLYGFLMVYNRNFIKPKGALLWTLLFTGLCIIGAFAYLHCKYE
jgi:CDP-diacylglycerol---serine O-phosphatidyltransferase